MTKHLAKERKNMKRKTKPTHVPAILGYLQLTLVYLLSASPTTPIHYYIHVHILLYIVFCLLLLI